MQQCKSEWLLLLDADEALDKESIALVAEFVKTTALDGAHFRIRNYTGSYSPENYSLHNAMRLIRNNGKYYFTGEIHEQITDGSGKNLSAHFTVLDAVVHHYGYLDDAVREKQKRNRNIPILKKQLEQNPNEPFILFNMGNEYLSMQDYKTALKYYEKSMSNLSKKGIAFVPHLFLRLAGCYENLGEYEKALKSLQESLNLFPACTDYEFRRAEILCKLRRYTLAIDSLEHCLKMGTPPPSLELIPGCGTYRAAYRLGDIYYGFEDYCRALKYYDKALILKPDFYGMLYRMGRALNKICTDKDEAARKLFSCFADPRYAPNAILGADILTEEGLYSQAQESLENLSGCAGHETELHFVRARLLLFQNQTENAVCLLNTVCGEPEAVGEVLRGMRQSSALHLFAGGLILEDEEILSAALDHIEKLCSKSDYAAALLMRDISCGLSPDDPCYKDEGQNELSAMLYILNILLRCGCFTLFEKMLRALNYTDSRKVLLRLAALYDANGLTPLAAEYIIRSIKEMDTIHAEGAEILLKHLTRMAE